MIPSITWRRFRNGRPRIPSELGNIGSIKPHCASVNTASRVTPTTLTHNRHHIRETRPRRQIRFAMRRTGDRYRSAVAPLGRPTVGKPPLGRFAAEVLPAFARTAHGLGHANGGMYSSAVAKNSFAGRH